MYLKQTLSRLHVCATLVLAQIIGSICVMVARATAPNAIGPGTVFPNVGTWDFSQGISGSPMASAPFWIALVCQIVIVLGYFWFYRKEQLGMCLFFVRWARRRLLTRISFLPKPGRDTDIDQYAPFCRSLSRLSFALHASLAHNHTLIDRLTYTSFRTFYYIYRLFSWFRLVLLGFALTGHVFLL